MAQKNPFGGIVAPNSGKAGAFTESGLSAAESKLFVSGIGTLFGLNWGPVTTEVAVHQFEVEAGKAQRGDAAAQAVVAQIQQEMYQAGYLTKNPVLGTVTTEDVTAFSHAVVQASRQGTPMDQYLSDTAQNSSAAGIGGAGGIHVYKGPVVPVTLTNPDDIKATADSVAQKLIGRKLKPNELSDIVNSIHSDETSIGQQQASADMANQEAQIQAQEELYGQGGGSAPTPVNAAASAAVVQTITQVANSLGVPPKLALAIAQQESGLNPNAVGDNGTSFGLFQLHQGGELGALSPQQASDPKINATVALTQVAAILKEHPDWSPGQIAAAAQRPGDPVGYAHAVNTIMGVPGASVIQPGQGDQITGSAPGGNKGTTTDVFLNPTLDVKNQAPSATGEATSYLENHNAPEYQAQNLLNVFQQIQSKLASPDAALNPHVLNTPVKM